MPVTPTYPGVYIEEISSGVRTIVGVATSVAAFVDYFARGPINRPVQIFNNGDFQREFGGLHSDSVASYGIQQFFVNGGQNAWVVRTAEHGTYATASVTLQDGLGAAVLSVSAGRRMQGEIVDDPGDWGNDLRIDVDHDTTSPSSLFNLSVSQVSIEDGREVTLRTEEYRNLSMDGADPRYAVEVVNEGSKLIQLARESASTLHNLPAQTGTVGTDASSAHTTLASGTSVDLTYDSTTVTVAINFTTAPSNVQEVRTLLQSAIRAVDPNEPLLAGATVQVVDNRLRVLAGRRGSGFNAATTFGFANNVGTPASDMGLTGATVNVQQYAPGSPATAGAQVSGTLGLNGNRPGAGDLIGLRDDKTGMYALEDVDLFNILCLPRTADLDSSDYSFAVSRAQVYCEERRAFMIMDLPPSENSMQDARDWLEQNSDLRHRNAAAYFPWVRVPDPLNGFRLKRIAPSGTLAGLYARTDSSRGVWKAPGGIEARLRNVPELEYKLSDPENGQLNPLGLNCLRSFNVYGNVSWGARTLDGADQQASEWKYVPVRRIALFIEESLFRGTQWVVFEPNDEPLWAQIRLNVGAFMQSLFRQGAFQGTTPQQAYLVKCDAETTTQDDINRGVVNVLVGFAPLKPAEFVIIRIQQIAGQIEV